MTAAELWTQVRVSFAGTIVELVHLRPGQNFTLGEGPDADLTYATPGLHRLVSATADGAVLASLETGELVALREDEWTRIELGPLTIEVGTERQIAPELGARPLDVGWWLGLASTALIVVTFLTLSRMAGEVQLPPLETDAAPYLAYTLRSEPEAAELRQERPELPPPPAVSHPTREETRRAKSREPAAATTPGPSLEQAEPGASGAERKATSMRLARSGSGPRVVAPMLQRDTSPAEAARSAGMLAAMAEYGGVEGVIATAATNFAPEVDDSELWASMTGGSIDVSVGGLDLIGSGRGGGVASEAIRSGAPSRPQPDLADVPPCLGSACERPRETSETSETRRVRVVETRVEGELDSKLALRFASSLGKIWSACLRGGEEVQTFELSYSVLGDGRIGSAKIPITQLSSKSRRCITTAIKTHAPGPGLTRDGRAAKVVQRVELR
ncbi:hypothetical protein ENSA5_47630 [Enhygromyxa salina]|uniref:Uncharacterized protein n=1 Tax=Enhygromyxa salina TaxID=215803 RepID=A0A2S9XIQ1_9BACT|nr:hypothetical protein [Enhygromyxa salina]PRP92722.1 hypothetical protein ENSA5_47630 [Enhygromyxa salina]